MMLQAVARILRKAGGHHASNMHAALVIITRCIARHRWLMASLLVNIAACRRHFVGRE